MPLDKRHKRQRAKNIALLIALLAFAALFYGLTLIKLAANAGAR
jgi:hypothetical protein